LQNTKTNFTLEVNSVIWCVTKLQDPSISSKQNKCSQKV